MRAGWSLRSSCPAALVTSERRRSLEDDRDCDGWHPRRCHKSGRPIVLLVMILLRLLMTVIGVSLAAGGLGLTMIGVFAFIGAPLLILGLAPISARANPRTTGAAPV